MSFAFKERADFPVHSPFQDNLIVGVREQVEMLGIARQIAADFSSRDDFHAASLKALGATFGKVGGCLYSQYDAERAFRQAAALIAKVTGTKEQATRSVCRRVRRLIKPYLPDIAS